MHDIPLKPFLRNLVLARRCNFHIHFCIMQQVIVRISISFALINVIGALVEMSHLFTTLTCNCNRPNTARNVSPPPYMTSAT